jgi:phi LC3 family holin
METNEDMKSKEEMMQEYLSDNFIVVNPQPRWKSWAVWVSVLGAVWTILNAFGLTEKWGIQESTFKTIVDAVGAILIGFGILNNPTDRSNF